MEIAFPFREAPGGVANALDGHAPKGGLMTKMEGIMQASPDNWKKYYSGDETELWLQRHLSLSDRIRYLLT